MDAWSPLPGNDPALVASWEALGKLEGQVLAPLAHSAALSILVQAVAVGAASPLPEAALQAKLEELRKNKAVLAAQIASRKKLLGIV